MDRFALQLREARDFLPRGDLDLFRVETELNDRHRWNRCLIMWIKDIKHRRRELWEFVVELVANPRGEVGEGFDKPLDVGIFDRVGAEAESFRDFRVVCRELVGVIS